MKVTVTEPESWKRVIEIEVPDQDVQKAFDEKLEKHRKDLKLPGFRQGKIPLPIIKQRFGRSIRVEIIEELIQKSYQQACEENKIEPVAMPRVSDLKDEEGKDLRFSIETEVDPPIEIKGYQKVKAKPSPKKIKEGDVDDAIKNLRERLADFRDIDRPAKKGDFIRFEYLAVQIDGEERKDVRNPTYPVELGGENRLKDFDKAITGHVPGDIVDVDVKFPKDYQDAAVAGKSAHFQVKLTAIQEKILPDVNEEFLKKIGEFNSEDMLREHLKKQMEDEENQRAKNEAYNKAIDTLLKDNPFEVPPARIEQYLDYLAEENKRYAKPGDPEPSREELDARYRESVIRSIKRQRVIDYVADKEDIKASQEEVDSEIQRLSSLYNQDFETLKQALRRNGTTNRIRHDIREQKTLDFLVGNMGE